MKVKLKINNTIYGLMILLAILFFIYVVGIENFTDTEIDVDATSTEDTTEVELEK
mgnify:FL=1